MALIRFGLSKIASLLKMLLIYLKKRPLLFHDKLLRVLNELVDFCLLRVLNELTDFSLKAVMGSSYLLMVTELNRQKTEGQDLKFLAKAILKKLLNILYKIPRLNSRIGYPDKLLEFQ